MLRSPPRRETGAALVLYPGPLNGLTVARNPFMHGNAGKPARRLKNFQAHFFGLAAEMIRRILIDHARNRQAAKRGDGAIKLSLDEAMATPDSRDFDLVALDDALAGLARLDPQQSRLVELRFFAGLSVEESAAVLGVSTATVKREWAAAKAWLERALTARPPGSCP